MYKRQAIILPASITVVQGITDTSNDVCAENAAHKQIFSGTEVKVDGEEFTIVRQGDILAVV